MVVTAAGNRALSTPEYPAAEATPGLLAVAANTEDDALASFPIMAAGCMSLRPATVSSAACPATTTASRAAHRWRRRWQPARPRSSAHVSRTERRTSRRAHPYHSVRAGGQAAAHRRRRCVGSPAHAAAARQAKSLAARAIRACAHALASSAGSHPLGAIYVLTPHSPENLRESPSSAVRQDAHFDAQAQSSRHTQKITADKPLALPLHISTPPAPLCGEHPARTLSETSPVAFSALVRNRPAWVCTATTTPGNCRKPPQRRCISPLLPALFNHRDRETWSTFTEERLPRSNSN